MLNTIKLILIILCVAFIGACSSTPATYVNYETFPAETCFKGELYHQYSEMIFIAAQDEEGNVLPCGGVES